MSDAAEKIVAALRAFAPGEAPTRATEVRALCGLSAGAFAGGVRALRNTGKLAFDSFELSASMRIDVAPAAVSATTAETLRDETRAEAEQRGRNRAAARTIGQVVGRKGSLDRPSVDDLTAGGHLQDLALRSDPMAAASIVREQWDGLWRNICAFAATNRQRPVPAMLTLIERGLGADR